MDRERRIYFSMIFYMLIILFCFYILKYFIADAFFVSFLISTLYFVGLYLRSKEIRFIPSLLHSTVGLFLGFVWIGFVVTIALNIANIFLHITITHRVIGLVFSLLVAFAAIVNNKFISNKVFTVHSSKVSKKIRIAQISDLHINGPRAKHNFEDIITQVLSQNPDVVVITGDLIDVPATPKPECFDMLYHIKTPILFVTGNHDYYAGVNYVTTFLTERGVHVLRNKKKVVKGITFYGYDDPTGKVNLISELDKVTLSKDNFNVLLYHQPRHVPFVAKKGFDLMFSGHTHAGQMYPFNYLVRLQFKYVVGLHKIKKMLLYINPGTSTWEIPMRIGSRNTVALFDIVPKKK